MEKDTDNCNDYNFELEPILDYIGLRGKWQYFQCFCLFLFGMASGMAGVSYAFPGYVPKYRCALPICESFNETSYIAAVHKLR